MPGGVGDIGAAGIEDAERAAKIPQSPADPVALQDFEDVAKPSEENGMRRMMETACLAAMHAHAFGHESSPGRVGFLEPRAIPAGRKRPPRTAPALKARDPWGAVVAQRHGIIGAAALRDVRQVRQFGTRDAPVVEAIDDDEALRILAADGGDGGADHFLVAAAGESAEPPVPGPGRGRLVEQIEAEAGGGEAAVAAREALPVKTKGIEGGGVPP